ncbi:MAG: hypothetical protein R2717_04695 [Schumannella sp.]
MLVPAGALGMRLLRERRVHALGAAAAAFALVAIASIAPPSRPTGAEELQAYLDEHAQTFVAETGTAAPALAERDDFDATPGIPTLKAEGTNYAWAKMVMLFGGWPITDDNITVFTRWMRQENGPPDWWNRNNPLNNGWGTTGGTFMSGYPNLVEAARWCADALNSNPGYAGIRDGFANALPAEKIEAAIWASPWATGHYNNGAHWHYTPVEVVEAPASAWG